MGAIARFFTWLARKLTFAVVLAVLGVTSLALWVFLRDQVDFDLRRLEIVRVLTGEAAQVREALGDVELRLASMEQERANEQDRAAKAGKLLADLRGQNSGLNRLMADQDQVKINEGRIASLVVIETDANRRVAELGEKIKRGQWERDGLQIALGRLDTQLKAAEARKSKALHYAKEAWDRYGRYVLTVVLIYFVGPPLGRVLMYFVLAPLISGRAPVRLGTGSAEFPEVAASRAALEVPLAPGDKLWVKEHFLQSSDEGLKKKTKTLLDWSMPFTCFAADLKELIQMHNQTTDATFRVTLSSQESQTTEIALVTIPAGASMVLRPSFISGAVGMDGGKLHIRRHWRFFKMQSWITGQLRYFEFVGPCRLLVSGSRGVRAETLVLTVGQPEPARRTNQDATIGFTPGLAYRSVRAETFWAYFRGMNPLFDDLFVGQGVFLSQGTSARGPQEDVRKFWSGLRSGVLRVFGL